MKLNLDIQLCISLNLTANQYTWLYLQFIGDTEKTNLVSPVSLIEQKHLESLGYIKILDSPYGNLFALKQKANDLFEERDVDTKWLEFKALYPIKSGDRRLHDQVDKCKNKYVSYIIKTGVHEEIMLGLNNEYKARRNAAKKGAFFAEWKMMSSYLNQKAWMLYVDYEEDVGNKEKTRAG